MLPLRVGGDEEIKEDRGDAGALGNTRSGVELRRGDIVVSAVGHSTTEVGGQPAYGVVSELGIDEGLDELD